MSVDAHAGGFEYQGRFYRWAVGDTGKDLMLIDRLTAMSMSEFFAAVEANADRGPLLLALIATSIRQAHPDWSVDRIVRLVTDLALSDVAFVSPDGDQDEEGVLPPPEASPASMSGEPSRSQSNGSSPSSTPAAASTSETSYAGPI